MKKICIYPGSFNPFHEGHANVVKQALEIFDTVQVLQCVNTSKTIDVGYNDLYGQIKDKTGINNRALVDLGVYRGLLCDYLKQSSYAMDLPNRPCAIIRGLRNGQDLEGDRAWQYWNQDLGIKLPFAYFICPRDLIHYSSSAIREIKSLRGEV